MSDSTGDGQEEVGDSDMEDESEAFRRDVATAIGRSLQVLNIDRICVSIYLC